MTLMTMMSTATPRVTPSTEIKVMTETNVLLGRRYRSASSSSNGKRDMGGKLKGERTRVNESPNHRRGGYLDWWIGGLVDWWVGGPAFARMLRRGNLVD